MSYNFEELDDECDRNKTKLRYIITSVLTGAVFQSTGNYDASFFLGGGLFLLGTLLHFVLFLPCMKSKKDEVVITVAEEQEMVDMHLKPEPEKPIRIEV